jgi:hypothetical protein
LKATAAASAEASKFSFHRVFQLYLSGVTLLGKGGSLKEARYLVSQNIGVRFKLEKKYINIQNKII